MDEKEVEDNYSAHQPTSFASLDPTDQNAAGGSIEMVDYMLNRSPAPPPHLSFAEVMQFADFRPKVHAQPQIEVSGDVVDVESCFFKFPPLPSPSPLPYDEIDGGEDQDLEEEESHRFSDLNAAAAAAAATVTAAAAAGSLLQEQGKSGSRRKRGRSMKTSEEVESQRMTHIAVERNRRRQMNEHLRVLRALMPTSYVQRGDQASIIGGAIEFVRELEQLLQCLESQKRRRLYGGGAAIDAAAASATLLPSARRRRDLRRQCGTARGYGREQISIGRHRSATSRPRRHDQDSLAAETRPASQNYCCVGGYAA